MDEYHSMNVIEVTKLIDLNKQVFEDNNEFESDTENVKPEVADPNVVIEKVKAKNQVYHARTKHIDVQYHFIRVILEEGRVRIQKLHTSKNPADMLTKVLAEIKFNLFGLDQYFENLKIGLNTPPTMADGEIEDISISPRFKQMQIQTDANIDADRCRAQNHINTEMNESRIGRQQQHIQTECMKTPRATLYEHNETPGGSIYWEPYVQGILILVEGTYYDTVDEAIDMYMKYAEIRGFEVKKSGQRLTKSGAVKHKYIMCNKEGVPKGINVDTLDPEYSDKQKRNTTTHVIGCKARIKLVLNIVTGRYKLQQFHAKHNHMLIPKEYKHFTKKQRKMTQGEKIFVVKAATNKIGTTRAHNLLSSMKGGYEYVHKTTDDFKNHQRDVNVFIGESDTQMLINKMENRKMYVPNFTFQYKVEKSELVAMFWADEVAKCNYKEFRDIVSFDATFNSNKYVNQCDSL
ncbi:FAR1-related sequence 5-like protein [Tanacetum coccineum]|uniref:FAR1-related sequence 5-like protein n=1 Tax=Tanacetum coccineum TaxID=301880 RepID=A0ABQ4ZMM8_9ASTR